MPKIVKDEEIYLAVIRVIAELGYASGTTKQMAEAAEISEMTLFRKFENKAQLVKQAIAFIVGEADFSNSAKYTGDLGADLLRVVKAYQNSAIKHGDFVTALIPEISRHPELLDSIDGPMNVFKSIGILIKRYQEVREVSRGTGVAHRGGSAGAADVLRHAGQGYSRGHLPAFDLELHVARFLGGPAEIPADSFVKEQNQVHMFNYRTRLEFFQSSYQHSI